jgi:hypothetical protein
MSRNKAATLAGQEKHARKMNSGLKKLGAYSFEMDAN